MLSNNSITIILQGNPSAKQRARKGAQGHWYNPQSDIMFITQKIIKQNLPSNFSAIKKGVPVECRIFAFFSPPKANKKIDYSGDNIPCLNKKDTDNIAKYILDAMNKMVFHDDNQIYSLTIDKYYSYNPRTEIEISWL